MKLNEAQRKLAIEGGTIEQINALADQPEQIIASAPTPTAPAPTAPAAPAAAAPVAAAPAASAPAPTVDANAGATILASVHEGIVASLQAQINAANLDLAKAKIAAEQSEANSKNIDALVSTVRTVLEDRLIAIGSNAAAAAAFDASTISAEFTRVDGIFKEKFKAGGVAATQPVSTPVNASQVNALDTAVMQFAIPS